MPVHSDSVIHIIDKIALYAVKYFYFIPCCVPRIREGLGHAVIRNGNGGMSPANRLLDDLLCIRQRVHIAHFGVQVQLHTLDRRRILTLLMLNDIDMIGIELNVLTVPCWLHLPLNAQPHSRIDFPVQRLCVLICQIFMNRN